MKRGWAPRRENDFAGLTAPHSDMGGKEYLRGSASRSDRAVVYMRGFTPHPDLGSFFGKKLPKDPKKPNCIGFYLSNNDSEQGCRRQHSASTHRPAALSPHTSPTHPPFIPRPPRLLAFAPLAPTVFPALTVVPSVTAPYRRAVKTRPSPRRESETANF